MRNFLDYLKYSGLSVIITFNPFHWYYIPRFHFHNEILEEGTQNISFLFLTIRFWIDDGSW